CWRCACYEVSGSVCSAANSQHRAHRAISVTSVLKPLETRGHRECLVQGRAKTPSTSAPQPGRHKIWFVVSRIWRIIWLRVVHATPQQEKIGGRTPMSPDRVKAGCEGPSKTSRRHFLKGAAALTVTGAVAGPALARVEGGQAR